MSRLPRFLAAGMVATLAIGAPVQAQPTAMRAEFAAPFAAHTEIIIDGRMWSCVGNACSSPSSDPRPTVVCRKLARKLGPVTRFATSAAELDEAGLASCNQDRK
jgi:hypothetical protein